MSAVTGDSHKNTEARRARYSCWSIWLQPLAPRCSESHFSKGGQGADALLQPSSAQLPRGLPRIVMVASG